MFLPDEVRTVLETLEKAGYEAYVVGGSVRDALLGKEPTDYDLTTAALPEEVKAVFSDKRILETGLKHGTVTLLLPTYPLEITTFRTERGYADHRHPDAVTFTRTLKEDLSRRDFTVNAMAYSPRRGLVDLFGGRDDLKRRRIRCVGDPDLRFTEDALRILRALRFAACLSFTMEDKTAAALHRRNGLLSEVSRERIAAELMKCLSGDAVGDILTGYADVLQAALPHLTALPDPKWFSFLPKDSVLRLAALCLPTERSGTNGGSGCTALLRSLRLSRKTEETVTALLQSLPLLPLTEDPRFDARLGLYTLKTLYPTHLCLREAIAAANGEDTVPFALRRHCSEELLREGICLSLSELAIGGEDLRTIGFVGKAIGHTLQRLLREVALGRLPNDAAFLKKAAQDALSS